MADVPQNVKIGDKDENGEIYTDIYYSHEDFLLYEIKNNGEVCKILGKNIKGNLKKIDKSIIEFETYLNSTEAKKKYAQTLANAMSYCLLGNSKTAKQYLEKQITIFQKERVVSNRLKYLTSCFVIVIINVIIAVILNFFVDEASIPNSLRFIYTLITFGSFGGFISVYLKVNSLDLEIFNKPTNQFWFGASRIFISMISSLIVYALIKADFIIGFLNEIDNNNYIFYTMACLSGFSEYFIPNALKSIEKTNSL